MKCKVCGQENISDIYCRNCGTFFKKKRSIFSKLNIFKRLNELEIENKRQAAALMKLWKLNRRVLPSLPPATYIRTGEDFIDYILELKI